MNKDARSRFTYTCLIYFTLAMSWLLTAGASWAQDAGSISLKGMVPERQSVALIPSFNEDKLHLEVQNTSQASMKLTVRQDRRPASVVVIEPSNEPVRIQASEKDSIFVGLESP